MRTQGVKPLNWHCDSDCPIWHRGMLCILRIARTAVDLDCAQIEQRMFSHSLLYAHSFPGPFFLQEAAGASARSEAGNPVFFTNMESECFASRLWVDKWRFSSMRASILAAHSSYSHQSLLGLGLLVMLIIQSSRLEWDNEIDRLYRRRLLRRHV